MASLAGSGLAWLAAAVALRCALAARDSFDVDNLLAGAMWHSDGQDAAVTDVACREWTKDRLCLNEKKYRAKKNHTIKLNGGKETDERTCKELCEGNPRNVQCCEFTAGKRCNGYRYNDDAKLFIVFGPLGRAATCRQVPGGAGASSGATIDDLRSPTSVSDSEWKKELPEGWEVVTHTDGRTYYYNREEERSQWEFPRDVRVEETDDVSELRYSRPGKIVRRQRKAAVRLGHNGPGGTHPRLDTQAYTRSSSTPLTAPGSPLTPLSPRAGSDGQFFSSDSIPSLFSPTGRSSQLSPFPPWSPPLPSSPMPRLPPRSLVVRTPSSQGQAASTLEKAHSAHWGTIWVQYEDLQKFRPHDYIQIGPHGELPAQTNQILYRTVIIVLRARLAFDYPAGTPVTVIQVPPIPITDDCMNDATFTDRNGNICEFYQIHQDQCGQLDKPEDIDETARKSCCACGGGDRQAALLRARLRSEGSSSPEGGSRQSLSSTPSKETEVEPIVPENLRNQMEVSMVGEDRDSEFKLLREALEKLTDKQLREKLKGLNKEVGSRITKGRARKTRSRAEMIKTIFLAHTSSKDAQDKEIGVWQKVFIAKGKLRGWTRYINAKDTDKRRWYPSTEALKWSRQNTEWTFVGVNSPNSEVYVMPKDDPTGLPRVFDPKTQQLKEASTFLRVRGEATLPQEAQIRRDRPLRRSRSVHDTLDTSGSPDTTLKRRRVSFDPSGTTYEDADAVLSQWRKISQVRKLSQAAATLGRPTVPLPLSEADSPVKPTPWSTCESPWTEHAECPTEKATQIDVPEGVDNQDDCHGECEESKSHCCQFDEGDRRCKGYRYPSGHPWRLTRLGAGSRSATTCEEMYSQPKGDEEPLHVVGSGRAVPQEKPSVGATRQVLYTEVQHDKDEDPVYYSRNEQKVSTNPLYVSVPNRDGEKPVYGMHGQTTTQPLYDHPKSHQQPAPDDDEPHYKTILRNHQPVHKRFARVDCKADNVDELSFKKGDYIEILPSEGLPAGWLLGRKEGEDIEGLVPESYLEEAIYDVPPAEIEGSPQETTAQLEDIYNVLHADEKLAGATGGNAFPPGQEQPLYEQLGQDRQRSSYISVTHTLPRRMEPHPHEPTQPLDPDSEPPEPGDDQVDPDPMGWQEWRRSHACPDNPTGTLDLSVRSKQGCQDACQESARVQCCMWNGGCTGYEYDNAADIRLVATPEKAENQAALCRKPPPPEQQAFNGARTPLYGDQEVRVTRTLTATMLSEGDVWVEAKIVIGTRARIVKVDVDGDVVLNIWQNHLREEFSSQMKVRADDKQWLWILLVFPRGSFVRAMSDIRTLTKASAKNKEMFVISTGSIGQIVHASSAQWDGQASAMVEFMHFGPKKRVVVPMEGLAGFQNLKVFLEGKIVAPVRDIKYQDDQQGSYNIPEGLEGVVKAVDDSGDVLVAWGPPDAEDAYVKLEDLDLLQLHPEGTAVAIARPEQAGVAVAFTYDLVKKEARLSPGQVVTIRGLVAPKDELNGERCVLLEYRRKRLWRARRLESGFEVFEIHRRHLSIEETGWKEDQTVRIVVPPEEDDQVIIALHGFNGKLLKYHGNDGWGVQMVTGSDKRAFLFQPEYLETEFRRGVHVVIRGLSDEAEIYNDRTCELHRFNHETLCWQAEVEDVGGVLAQRGYRTRLEIPLKKLKLKDVTGNPDSMGAGGDDDMESNGAYEDSEMIVNQNYESSKGPTTVDEHLLVRSGSVGSQVRPRLSESRRKRFKSVGEDSEEAHLQRQRNQKKAPLPAPKGWKTKFDSENGRFFHYDPDNVENWKFADEAMTDFMKDFATEKIRHEDVPSTKPRSRSRSLKRSRSIQEVDMEDSKEARRKYLEGAEGDEGTTLPGGTTLIRASTRTKMGTELCVADVTEFKANDKVKISQGSQSETCTIRDMTPQLFDDHIWIITVHEQLQYTYEEGATIKKVVQALGSVDMTVNPSYESVQQLRRSGEVLETKVREEAKPGSAIIVESSKGMERGDFIELISGDKKHLSQIEATRPSIDMVIIAPPSTQMFPKGSTVRVMKAGGSKKSTARNSVSLLQTKSDLEAAP